ncbi:hypothetical protein [Nocardia farcinica]|uniref:hypothetical protein n=1 Tax=Nocardia farcinica TaxID=37329 RepID=UPI003792404B
MVIPKPKEFRPSGGDDCLRVRLNHLDVEGPWCLTQIEQPHFVDLLQRIRSFEQMRCRDVFGTGSQEGKVYKVEDLPNVEARKRLEELEYDDQTEIARLRITGERRLYGFLWNGGPEFYALWWDPRHEIWPSPKKHT